MRALTWGDLTAHGPQVPGLGLQLVIAHVLDQRQVQLDADRAAVRGERELRPRRVVEGTEIDLVGEPILRYLKQNP